MALHEASKLKSCQLCLTKTHDAMYSAIRQALFYKRLQWMPSRIWHEDQ